MCIRDRVSTQSTWGIKLNLISKQDPMLRKVFVGGNWKCNLTIAQATEFTKSCINYLNVDASKQEVVIAPIFTQIPLVQNLLSNKNVQISAQNSSATSFGAYTGEISPDHLVDLGLQWTILGHSERRQYYGESNEIVGTKTKLAISKGLNVIACIGERLEERESNQTIAVVEQQLSAIRTNLSNEHWQNVVIAYEPVWAIGTGKVASPQQAQEVHDAIRKWLGANISNAVADQTRIIYGGSVTEANCEELIQQRDIDGFLVGGASLKPQFNQIVEACKLKK
eukprot:TRINITY_DN4825_c0_g1_i1.p1 TRINITY_DN4825_c0_g1~~TRINITY_DN4825_c0_g1_i1.p1  ORF type:complete len:281 (-),score=79.48 TRINITY_DN4825_c0_g1_i1:82-924(-)